MEHDLFFALIPKSDWKRYSLLGKFEPEEFLKNGYISFLIDTELEAAANKLFEGQNELVLLVIDSSRVESPIKHDKSGDINITKVFGTIPMDAIIDRIKVNRDSKGNFSIRVKHQD